MKYRHGFVTNSSSSSFIIAKKHLTHEQLEEIRNHCPPDIYDKWDIDEDENYITGGTIMDNFDMYSFMQNIGVDPEQARWSCWHTCFDLNEKGQLFEDEDID